MSRHTYGSPDHLKALHLYNETWAERALEIAGRLQKESGQEGEDWSNLTYALETIRANARRASVC
jgi:hypothetical protein